MINICVYFCEVFHSQVWTGRGSLNSPRPQSSALGLRITSFFFFLQKMSSAVKEQSVQHLQRFNCKSLDIRIHIQYALSCIWMTFLSLLSFLWAAQNVCGAGKLKGFPRTEQKPTLFGFLYIPLLLLCTACKNEKGVGEKSEIYDLNWSVYLSFWKNLFHGMLLINLLLLCCGGWIKKRISQNNTVDSLGF